MIKKLFILVTSVLVPLLMNAQKTDSLKLAKIQVLARVTPQKVLLRWAPDNPSAWILGNRFGYVVERYTFLKNGKMTEKHEKMLLTPHPVKPWPLENWAKMVDTSDYAAVAAQAIYGEDFEVDVNKSGNAYSIFNKAKEIESRYTFALHSANQSLNVAFASALSFADTTSRKDESYLYRIYIPLPKEIQPVDTGMVFVNAGKQEVLPKIKEIIAEASGNAVMISWDTRRYERDYVSYIIERSDDGGHNFLALSDRPYVNLGNENEAIPGRVVYMDSLPAFNTPYFYRIRGRTPFAENGPASDSIKVVAQKGMYNPPSITSADVMNGGVVIKWELPPQNDDAVKGFTVERALSLQDSYKQLNKELLPPDTRIFIDSVPAAANYYRIWAIDKEGTPHGSLPYLVQPEDSIPPVPPVDLTGTIDTSGLVHISWKSNRESDLLGYRIYRSYFKGSEFVQVTADPISPSEFSEKLNLKNLNKYMYYKITACDRHHNQSGFSATLQLKQPDLVSPAPPAIKSVKALENGIQVTLIPSSSDDVEKYVIYRKEDNDTIWTLEKIMPFDNSQIVFTDSTVSSANVYAYNVLTVDSAGNESVPASTIRCKAINKSLNMIPVLRIRKDMEKKAVELQWSVNGKNVESITIYKAVDNEPISQFVTRPAEAGAFIDQDVKQQHSYRYMIKAFYKDGTESEFSKVETVGF